MAQTFIPIQAKHSAAMLRSAALSVALMVLISPVRAEPVTLSCLNDDGAATLTLRINYATGLVEQLGPNGKAFTNRIAPNASISNNAIVWSVQLMDTGLQTPRPMKWEGTIDRLSGKGSETFSREPDWHPYRTNFTCRQATQKF